MWTARSPSSGSGCSATEARSAHTSIRTTAKEIDELLEQSRGRFPPPEHDVVAVALQRGRRREGEVGQVLMVGDRHLELAAGEREAPRVDAQGAVGSDHHLAA